MSDDWYKAERTTQVRDGLITKIVPSEVAPTYLEIYGTWTEDNGAQSAVQLLDWAKSQDQSKLRPQTWLRQVVVWDTYYKKGDWFARKYVAVRSFTAVKNIESDMWERLELN